MKHVKQKRPSQPGNLQFKAAGLANQQTLTGEINAYCYMPLIMWLLVAHQKPLRGVKVNDRPTLPFTSWARISVSVK